MKASVIVLCWNGIEYLPGCLDSLSQQDYPDLEIIVVDNGSTDNSADWVATHFPTIQLIRNKHNLGFAAGNNIGLAAATGDVMVLLNQDTRVKRDWLAQLVQGITSDPRIGIGGCKILYPDEQTIQHAGGIIRLPLAFPDHFGYRQPDDGRWDQQRDLDYVTGAAIAFRRDVLETIGPLDEGFYPAYYEDADLCARARAAGYTATYFPHASLIHLESTSIGWNSPTYLQYMHRGRLRYLLKHVSPTFFLNDVVPAERERLRSLDSPEERLALWQAFYASSGGLAKLIETDLFVAASRQDWAAAQTQIEAALDELRQALFQGTVKPPSPTTDRAELAHFHHDRLGSILRHTRPTALVTDFIPAEHARWAAQDSTVQEMLAELYRQLGPQLRHLLPDAYPGEIALVEVVWERQLANPSDTPLSWTTAINHLRGRLEMLERQGEFHNFVFVSHDTLAGSLATRLRMLWYKITARLGIQTLADQQQAFNANMVQTLREVQDILDAVERIAIENDRAITQLRRRVAAMERRSPGEGR